MLRSSRLLALALPLLGACNTRPAEVGRPKYPESIERAFVGALLAEAADSTSLGPWLDLLDRAVSDPLDPRALEAGLAAIDAIAFQTPSHAQGEPLAYRTRDLFTEASLRIGKAWERAGAEGRTPTAESVVLRQLLARAAHELAMYVGDEATVRTWAGRRGCVEEATVVGPTSPNALLGLDEPTPVPHDKPLAGTFVGVAPFATRLAPERAVADACRLLVAGRPLEGTRAVVVDVEAPRPMTASFVLETGVPAVLEVGGKLVLRRSNDAARGRNVTRFGAAELPAGKTRVVVRLAHKQTSTLELDVLGDDGVPLKVSAPKVGDEAPGAVKGAFAFGTDGAGQKTKWSFEAHARVEGNEASAALALSAAALAATGDDRRAEHLLELRRKVELAELPPLPPIRFPLRKEDMKALAERQKKVEAIAPRADLACELLYARHVPHAADMPESRVLAGQKAAHARLKHYFPRAWETRALAADIVRRSKPGGEGTTQALKELGLRWSEVEEDAYQLQVSEESDPSILAAIALTAGELRLVDVYEQAYARLAEKAPSSPLLASVDRALHGRVGVDRIPAACRGALSRAGTDCLWALEEVGKDDEALAELARLRRLRSAPRFMLDNEIALRMRKGDVKGATAIYDAMPRDERQVMDLVALLAASGRSDAAKERFNRDKLDARDAPYSFLPMSRLLGLEGDPAVRYEPEGRRLVEADRKQPVLEGAATAVLLRAEEYTLDESGLLHFVGYDIRRVTGTTDVAMGGGIFAPMIEGRIAGSLLRRRIHKKDGRTIEPNAAKMAQQANSDLSQLEAGDYVEHLFEGWALPDSDGQLVLDMQDLLPERTSVREARVVFTRPASTPLKLWSHARLGKADVQTSGGQITSTWRLADAKPRSLEPNVPVLERSVGISFGTRTWDQIGQAMRNNLRVADDDRDPYLKRWLGEVLVDAAGKPVDAASLPQKELVQRVITATGKKIKRASGGLSDAGAVFGGAVIPNARYALESGAGSRGWVVFRALRELGIKADVAIAETQPFSTAADFPPHVGRFRRTLVVAHLDGGDEWIDADVFGPPLPLGRVSPELRGRSALLGTGKIVPVEGASADGGDEIDVRLALDEAGDATGTLTLLLRGEQAQVISEVLEDLAGSARREKLREQVHAWLPRADVEDVTVSSQDGAWEVGLRAQVRINGFGQPVGKDGKTWALPGFDPIHDGSKARTLGARLGTAGARQDALTVRDAIQFHLRRRIELPKGAKLVGSPAELDVKLGALAAARKGKYGDVIEEDFRLSLETTTVSADGYAAFAERLRQVDDGFLASTRVLVPTARIGTKKDAPKDAPKAPKKGK